MLAKISKIARFILLLLLFSIGFIYIVFRSRPVQTWLVQKATTYLSEELKTKVKISGVDIEFFKTAVFENVYIEDHQQDTLLYFSKVKADYNDYDNIKRIVKFNSLALEGGKVIFGVHKGERDGNYEFLIDYFDGGPRDTTKPKVIWTIYSKDVSMNNVRFDYFNDNDTAPDFMDFNYNDMSFRNINADLQDFYLIDDSLHFQSNHMSFKEKCGFIVDELIADTKIHEGGLEFEKLLLTTPFSKIGNSFKMLSKDWKDYNDFNNKIMMKANLDKAIIDSKDLAYFSHYLKNYKTPILASGYAEGYLVKLKGKNTKLRLFDQTTYEGDWTMTGLPDLDNTIMEFEVKDFRTDYNDLNLISLGNVPTNLASLGKIGYKGNFSGFYNDFVTFGKITTILGDFDADINLKYKDGMESATYSGKLKTSEFKLKTFYPESPFDNAGFDLKINGTGLDAEKYAIDVEGDISQLGFQNYNYHNITAKGTISKKLFSGVAKIRDPHLNLDFEGEFNSAAAIPVASFNATVFNADLSALGFDTTEQNVKGNFKLNFTGKNLDDAVGTIVGTDISVYRNKVTVYIPKVELTSSHIGNDQKELKLLSDLADIVITGKYTLSRLDISLLHMLHQLIPVYFDQPKQELPNEDFKFTIDLKQPDQFTTLYVPDLSLAPCKADGYYRSMDQTIVFNTSNEKIVYNGFKISNLVLKADKEKNSVLKLDITADNFTDDQNIKSENIVVKSTVFDNIIDFKLTGLDTGYSVNLKAAGRMVFGKDSINLQMSDADIMIGEDKWFLSENASVLFTDNKYELMNFVFSNGKQSLLLNGEYGNKSKNTVKMNIDQFAVTIINKVLKDRKLPLLSGVSQGEITYSMVGNKPVITSDFSIENLCIGKDTIGNLSIVSTSAENSSIQNVVINIEHGGLDSLEIKGIIDFKSKTDNMDLVINLPPSDLKIVEPYLKEVVSRMKGKVSTENLLLKGTFDHPLLTGDIHINNATMIIDYLNIPINFSTVIHSERNLFSTQTFKIFDSKGNSANAKGNIYHSSFDNFILDLNIRNMNNFRVMNTTAINNSLYYGIANASGSGSFYGPFDNLDIKIDATTMPGTHFYLPISDGNASGLPSYVHFKTAKKRIKKTEDDFPIRSLVMNIEATTDANVEIIFDETLGDKITGTGFGNIRMEMTKSGDFYMFGTYTVDKGRYLFTAFDLYNKPFAVRRGGTISWYGDPMDAKLNLVAYNTEKANPAPLLEAVTFNNNSTSNANNVNSNITAESELYIKGNLFSPDITFGLNFPKLQSEASNSASALSSVIARIKSDKEEVSRQVFSLLIMKQFITPTFAQNGAGLNNVGSSALSSAGSDLLSAQLSNWLNKIDPNWKVNIIYKNGTYLLPAEYGVALSSKFFNDKLTFDGSFSNYSNRPNIGIDYKVTKKGNLRVKAYTRSNLNQVNTSSLSAPINTTGVGLVYTKEFNTLRKKKKKKKGKSG
ncbi:MAG: translocation/assembly module TamB domain-containing protein [Bacteroidota bacterium]